ncbi:MAG: hypothetical protein ABGW77_02770 [Campylobacterales bacterium]
MREINRFRRETFETPQEFQLRQVIEEFQGVITPENPPTTLFALLLEGIKGALPLLPKSYQGNLLLLKQIEHLTRQVQRGESLSHLYPHRMEEYSTQLRENTLHLRNRKSLLKEFRLLLLPLKEVVEGKASPKLHSLYSNLLNLYFYTYRLITRQEGE